MSEGFDVLIHRHLDGTLSEDEQKAFEARLLADVDARRRLAEMAFDHAQLKEILEPAKAVGPRRWLHVAAAAAILLGVGVAIFVGQSKPADVDVPAPAKGAPKREGYQGFHGRVHARALERREKNRVSLKVVEVLAVRASSDAAAPGKLVGETIGILPPRLRDGEPPGPERDHAMFLQKLQPGQEVVLELRHLEAGDFAIEALTEEQAEWARQGVEKKKVIKEGPKETPKRDGDKER